MYGASRLAATPIAAADLAKQVGFAPQRDSDFMPRFGTFEIFMGETDDVVPSRYAG
jgi:hypothetical protein